MNSSPLPSTLTISQPHVVRAFGRHKHALYDDAARIQMTRDLYIPEKSVMRVQYLPRTIKDNIIHFLDTLLQSDDFDKDHLVTMSRIAQDHYLRHQDGNAVFVPLNALLNVGKKADNKETVLQVSELTKPLIDIAVKDYTNRDKRLNRIAETILDISDPHDDDLLLQSKILQQFNQSVTEIAPSIKTYNPFSLGETATQKVQIVLQQYKTAKNDSTHQNRDQQDYIDQSITALSPFRHGKHARYY